MDTTSLLSFHKLTSSPTHLTLHSRLIYPLGTRQNPLELEGFEYRFAKTNRRTRRNRLGITTQVQISTLLQIAKRLESDRRECKSKSQTPSWSLKMKPGCKLIENFCRSKEKLLTIYTSLSFINER